MVKGLEVQVQFLLGGICLLIVLTNEKKKKLHVVSILLQFIRRRQEMKSLQF